MIFLPADEGETRIRRNIRGYNVSIWPEDGIAAQKPKGVPEENWLPINRKDEDIGAIMRIYVPDLGKMKIWHPPQGGKNFAMA